MAVEGDGSQAWVDVGLTALAEGGIDRVRVEVLAQMLGITKGGFYRRFKDRAALLEAMLESWAAGRIDAITKQTDLGGLTASQRLAAVIRLFAERANAQGMAIELAVRQWARSDAAAAATVQRVDAARLAAVVRLYEMTGLDYEAARARGVLFYAFIFGRGLLFLRISAAERARLVAVCIETLTGERP